MRVPCPACGKPITFERFRTDNATICDVFPCPACGEPVYCAGMEVRRLSNTPESNITTTALPKPPHNVKGWDYQTLLKEIDECSFHSSSYSLSELNLTFGIVIHRLAPARKIRCEVERNQRLAVGMRHASVLLKAMAQKWRERGEAALSIKIEETKGKIADRARKENFWDGAFLVYLEEEWRNLRQ